MRGVAPAGYASVAAGGGLVLSVSRRGGAGVRLGRVSGRRLMIDRDEGGPDGNGPIGLDDAALDDAAGGAINPLSQPRGNPPISGPGAPPRDPGTPAPGPDRDPGNPKDPSPPTVPGPF